MNKLFHPPASLVVWLWLLFTVSAQAQVCQGDNQALAFDGNGDYISTALPASISGSSTFTIEAWFYANSPGSNCAGDFRPLVALLDPSTGYSFEVGICNGGLLNYWFFNGGFPLGAIQMSLTDYSRACHHLAVVRNGSQFMTYIDGGLIYTGSLGTNAFVFNTLYVGRGAGVIVSQDWDGQVDEIRLWSTVRSVQQINDYKDCTLSGYSAGLEVNWPLDFEGSTPYGDNSPSGLNITQVTDAATNPTIENGMLHGFDLTFGNLYSNFVCQGCISKYILDISDQISLFPTSLISICAGEKAHFCVSDNGNTSLPPGAMVTWESSENNLPFTPDPDLTAYPYAANALCFGVRSGIITNSGCNTVGPGYVDRRYRAKIEKKSGPPGQQEICTYYSSDQSLRICCPPTGGTIQIVSNIPGPWCEGDNVNISAFLNPNDPWLPFGPNVTIDWCLVEGTNVTNLPQFQNLLSFSNLQIVVGVDNICLQAKIHHCTCPAITVEKCINVDPIPVCGTIDVSANPPIPITQLGTYLYEICPGDYTTLEMVSPFNNCTPVWQYHFGPAVPAQNSPGWTDLGTSNSSQNTNTLPQLNPLSPAFWPPGVDRIFYRIECRPKSYPNSGCDPCYSNLVEIRIKPSPPSGVISGPTQYCENGPYPILTITPNLPGNWEYSWIWNGILEFVGLANTYTINKPGCYWVGISNGCEITKVGPYCVQECAPIPIIKCPTDNPCACDGQPITLNGCDSYDTCNSLPLTYSWQAWPSGNTGTGCTFTDIPDPAGTTYYLTVTDALGCSATSKPFFIKPCN